jgi:hypothetical protein
MDVIVLKNKMYAKNVTWDLAGVEMSDQEAIQKHLDMGYEPFGAVPHIKRDAKMALANPNGGGVVTDNIIFLRKPNVTLVEVKPDNKKKNEKDEAAQSEQGA